MCVHALGVLKFRHFPGSSFLDKELKLEPISRVSVRSACKYRVQRASKSPGNFQRRMLEQLWVKKMVEDNVETHIPDFSYMEFVYNATELPLEETYDYIVIGGGTTGCPLAATLSEKYKVLVLERGGTPSQYPSVMSLDGFGTSLLEADDKDSPAEEFISEDGVKLARGRILGGTSMVNAAYYSRAEKECYIEYGIDFDGDRVMDAYKWVEDTIVSKPKLKMWQVAIRAALVEIGIGPDNGYTLDHIEGTKTGGSTFDNAGRRHGSVELLNKANRENIVVGVHAMVEKIIFSSSNSTSSGLTALGAMYKDSEGRLHKALIQENGEVILSAGTLGSPQLLLLSGIGPKSDLSSMNIPVVYDNPYVGQYMQDMPRNDIHIQQPFSAAPSVAQVVGIRTNSTYIEALSAALPLYFPTKSGTYSPTSVLSTVDVGSILLKSAKVFSTGFLHLASSVSASANPIVRFNYFQVPADLQICAAKVRTAAELFKTEAMDIFKFQDFNGTRYFKFLGDPLPSNLNDEAAMESYCRTTLATFWHYHGGCLVGKVVDENLKVEGVDALRVVDFSTFAGSPGTNPQATLLMLGRYIGVKIIQEREKNGRSFSSCQSSF